MGIARTGASRQIDPRRSSMYAVVSTGGKQYRVEPGTTLAVEKLAVEPGSTVTFDRVLLVGDGDETTVGTPTIAGATVSGTVLGDERGPKIVIFKFKQKVKYRRHTGHRQQLTRVRIDEITRDGTSTRAEDETAPARRRRTTPRAAEAEDATPANEASPAAESSPKAKAPARPRRARATASAQESETDKAAEPKRTATRRASPRKKAESEE
jgi:large subunit ribosomal protein L21